MAYRKYDLPEYPQTCDMWDKIASDPRPKLVYGMGNGADKLFSRLSLYGVVPADVFASDGFVRGHSYRGYRVKSFSEVKENYDDFIILLSFASNREEVLEMLTSLCDGYDVYVPDMPVAGDEYFDKDFYNSHYKEIKQAYDSLSDAASKNAFSAIINYKLSGRAEYLFNCHSPISDIYDLIPEVIRVSIDAGAYNGDTAREMKKFRPELERIYAIEPDKRNYKKLLKYVEENSLESSVFPINSAVGESDSEGVFIGSGNRNSSISSTKSYKNREECISVIKIDSLDVATDYIKYDVEGAEAQALRGSEKSIEKYHPALLVSAYHRSEDIFSLVNYIKENHPFYSLYMRRTLCLPAWEIALIAIDENKKQEGL